MSKDESQESQEISSISEARGNTKSRAQRVRRCCFTLNNWTEEESQNLKDFLTSSGGLWVIGKEVGEEGTPHLQGYVRFKNQRIFKTLLEHNKRIHWEKCKGTEKENIRYCCKDGSYDKSFPDTIHEKLLKSYSTVIWKDWQKRIIDICDSSPDSRTFNWFWESDGNVGKSFLSKYLFLKYKAIIADGKKDNVFNQVNVWTQDNKDESPRVIILNIPRHNLEFINYGMLEQLKNGLIYSGKYEGGCLAFESPHIIIFANEYPHTHKISEDRWNIIEIE